MESLVVLLVLATADTCREGRRASADGEVVEEDDPSMVAVLRAKILSRRPAFRWTTRER